MGRPGRADQVRIILSKATEGSEFKIMFPKVSMELLLSFPLVLQVLPHPQAIPNFGQSWQQTQNQAHTTGLQGTGALATPPMHTHVHTCAHMSALLPEELPFVPMGSHFPHICVHRTFQAGLHRGTLSFFLSSFFLFYKSGFPVCRTVSWEIYRENWLFVSTKPWRKRV